MQKVGEHYDGSSRKTSLQSVAEIGKIAEFLYFYIKYLELILEVGFIVNLVFLSKTYFKQLFKSSY